MIILVVVKTWWLVSLLLKRTRNRSFILLSAGGSNPLLKHLILILTFCLGFGCSDTQTKKSPGVVAPTIQRKPKSTFPDSFKVNYTDELGQKQGKWNILLKGVLWKTEFYKDDKLNGKCTEFYPNGDISESSYVAGKRHGYFNHNVPDSKVPKVTAYWQNGKRLWTAFPSVLQEFLISIKPFHIEADSVFIDIPYNSGKTFYRGLVTNTNENKAKEKGIHYFYFESGRARATLNYDKDRMVVLDEEGNVVTKSTITKWREGI